MGHQDATGGHGSERREDRSAGASLVGDTDALLRRAESGDEDSIARLFNHYRPRLKRMVLLRMDPRVRARCDASDVLQDAYVELSRRIPEYAANARVPFFLWLRMITCERLAKVHRGHLGAAMRDAARDVSLQQSNMPEASSVFLASQLAGHMTSVHRHVERAELQRSLQAALDRMDPRDREVLALRHFEELSTEETASVLGLTRSGVLKRYTRALRRLRTSITDNTDLRLN